MTAPLTSSSASTSRTPPLAFEKPETLGLSAARLQAMADAFQRDIDQGTIPGVVAMVARRGRIGWFEALGRQAPDADTPMAKDSIFRIFSMTKPLVSLGIMQLAEDGKILLTDPLHKFIPEFAEQRVATERNGALDYTLPLQPITIHDLLRHTSGLTYEITGEGMIQRQYREQKLYRRDITNAEHAAMIAKIPLVAQPGTEWHYSRSTDVLGRVIEMVSGQTLGGYLTKHMLAPLQMTDTGFHTAAGNAGRIAQAFDKDPWTGEKVKLFNPLDIPKMESGGGGLVSTAMDYARFCEMLRCGGALNGERIIGSRTLRLMASDHLAPHVTVDSPLMTPGHGFGLGFSVRTHEGLAPFAGNVGQYFWSGVAGTFFWVDPKEDLFAVFLSQGPGQREYFRTQIRSLVYAAIED